MRKHHYCLYVWAWIYINNNESDRVDIKEHHNKIWFGVIQQVCPSQIALTVIRIF